MGELPGPGVVDVPAGFFEVLEHVVFGSDSPEVFEGVAHGEGHVAGVVPCFTGEGGVGGVVGGVVDHVAGVFRGCGAGASSVGGGVGFAEDLGLTGVELPFDAADDPVTEGHLNFTFECG